MRSSKDEIIADIEARIRMTGGGYSNWCVGVAKDSQGPLFETHIREDLADGWLYREAFMPSTARDVLEHFVSKHGTMADQPSAEGEGRLVYAYLKRAA